jgi:hypothetical protein
MDYGHSLEFGYFLIPDAGDPRGVLLTHLALDHGFGTFVLMGEPDSAMLRTFIEDVAPHVRERVATARALVEAV